MILNNACTCNEFADPNCEWEHDALRPISTKTVQFENIVIDGQKVEQGWFYWLIQKTKDAATEGERVQFGCETHCHLFNRHGKMIGWRVYLP